MSAFCEKRYRDSARFRNRLDPAHKFELMFRLYAPMKALFDKTWVLPDAEKVQ
jgi:hypothetical protein